VSLTDGVVASIEDGEMLCLSMIFGPRVCVTSKMPEELLMIVNPTSTMALRSPFTETLRRT